MPGVTWAARASGIWRPWNTDGVPSSGFKKPAKADIRAYFLQIESALEGRRWRLPSNTTFYVHPSGTNSLTKGLSDGTGAFLTIQYAINYVRDYVDTSFYTVVVQVADGVWSSAIQLYDAVGADRGGYLSRKLVLRGNLTTPASCRLTYGGPCIKLINSVSGWVVEGFQMEGLAGIQSDGNGFVYCGKNIFRTTQYHLAATYRSFIEIVDDIYVDNNVSWPWLAQYQSHIVIVGGKRVAAITSPPATSIWVLAEHGSTVAATGLIVDANLAGTTGLRYAARYGSSIDTGGGGANFFPGNSAGTAASGYYG